MCSTESGLPSAASAIRGVWGIGADGDRSYLGDHIQRFNYGWSVLHSLAVGMLDDDSAGTDTVMRPDTVRAYAAEAGFGRVDVLPLEHDFWRFYRLVP